MSNVCISSQGIFEFWVIRPAMQTRLQGYWYYPGAKNPIGINLFSTRVSYITLVPKHEKQVMYHPTTSIIFGCRLHVVLESRAQG